MHTETVILWDDADAENWKRRVDEAFNRVINFCNELLPSTERECNTAQFKALRRIVDGRFTEYDIETVAAYGQTVFERIYTLYHDNPGEYGKAVLQAADNLSDTLQGLKNYVYDELKTCVAL